MLKNFYLFCVLRILRTFCFNLNTIFLNFPSFRHRYFHRLQSKNLTTNNPIFPVEPPNMDAIILLKVFPDARICVEWKLKRLIINSRSRTRSICEIPRRRSAVPTLRFARTNLFHEKSLKFYVAAFSNLSSLAEYLIIYPRVCNSRDFDFGDVQRAPRAERVFQTRSTLDLFSRMDQRLCSNNLAGSKVTGHERRRVSRHKRISRERTREMEIRSET